jgi:twinkle protein
MMAHPIAQHALDWFAKRGISEDTVHRIGIFSAKFVKTGDDQPAEVVPDAAGKVICFPFIEKGKLVNQKNRFEVRDGSKRYSQTGGARKTFFNADILDDALLAQGLQPLVITEGEMDALTSIEVGHHWAVSVPDGAPADVDQFGNPIPLPKLEELDPSTDLKFQFVLNNWDRLRAVKSIILATDDDGPGRRLRVELARRLGEARCSFIVYPPETVVRDGDRLRPCKDLNEVLLHFGPDAVVDLIRDARRYPVHGLFGLDDYPDRGKVHVLSTGFRALDPFFKLYEGAFIVGSGLPGSGKSALFNQIAFNCTQLYRWHCCLASFEMPVKPYLLNQLRGFYLNKHPNDWDEGDKYEADRYISRHFSFIAARNHADAPYADVDEPEPTVDWVLERAADSIIRHGSRICVIDPWNELHHKKDRNQARDEYVNDSLRKFKAFCSRWGCCLIIVAHPTKDAALSVKGGSPMSLYDISDGAAWANKAELGIIVTRTSQASDFVPGASLTRVDVRKVKFHESGQLGEAFLDFDVGLRRFATGYDHQEAML